MTTGLVYALVQRCLIYSLNWADLLRNYFQRFYHKKLYTFFNSHLLISFKYLYYRQMKKHAFNYSENLEKRSLHCF